MPKIVKYISPDYLIREVKFNNRTLTDLSLEFGVSRGHIRNCILSVDKNFKMIESKSILDNNVFETIDSEHKAYWLGFLYADGCVYISPPHYELVVGLSSIDVGHLEKFKIFLKSNKKLYKFNNGTGDCLRIQSKKICEDLINKGCIERKSLVLEFPNDNIVPNYLINHFIRGFFDGDGSIYFQNQCCWGIGFYSTLKFNNYLSNYFYNNKIVRNINYIKRCSQSAQCWSLTFTAIQDVYNLINWMYDNSTIYLDRKFVQKNIALGYICNKLSKRGVPSV